MADEKMIDRAEHVLYKTYNRFPIVLDHGEGMYLYDTEGKNACRAALPRGRGAGSRDAPYRRGAPAVQQRAGAGGPRRPAARPV